MEVYICNFQNLKLDICNQIIFFVSQVYRQIHLIIF